MSDEIKYQFTKDDCQKMIHGVCPSCGGVLEPIETVDNANQPTHWAGCLKCSRFSWGIEPQIYKTAHRLFTEWHRRAYHEPGPPDPEMRDYWEKSQISSLALDLGQALRIYNEEVAIEENEKRSKNLAE